MPSSSIEELLAYTCSSDDRWSRLHREKFQPCLIPLGAIWVEHFWVVFVKDASLILRAPKARDYNHECKARGPALQQVRETYIQTLIFQALIKG